MDFGSALRAIKEGKRASRWASMDRPWTACSSVLTRMYSAARGTETMLFSLFMLIPPVRYDKIGGARGSKTLAPP